MTRSAVADALPLLGTVGVMGLFLPSIETAWKTAPQDADGQRVRKGEQVYVGAAVAVGLLAAYGQGSIAPLLMCTGMAVLVVAVYEHALRNAC